MPEAATSKAKSEPAVVAFMTVVFAVPFTSGSLWFIAYTYAVLLLFVIYGFCIGRQSGLYPMRQLKRHYPLVFWLLCAFLCSSVVSYLSVVLGDAKGGHKLLATLQYAGYLLISAYTFMLARFVLLKRLSHEYIFLLIVAGTLVLMTILFGLYHFADAPNAERWGIDPPVGIHARIMGMLASVSVLVCMVPLLLGSKPVEKQLLLYVCLFLCSGFLVWTGSRMSMLVTIFTGAMIATLTFIYYKAQWRRLALVVMVIALSLPVAEKASVFGWTGLQRVIAVTAVPEEPVADSPDQLYEMADKVSSGRMEIWAASIAGVKRSPWFGLGPHGYLFMPERPDLYYQSHNMVLQFLVEWGVIGCVLLMALLICLAWQGVKNLGEAFRQGDRDYIVAAAVVFSLTLNGLTDGTYFMMLPLFLLATGFALFPLLTLPVRRLLAEHIDHSN